MFHIVKSFSGVFISILAVQIGAGTLAAQDVSEKTYGDSDWFVAAGLGVISRSSYEGSDDIETDLIPFFEVEYKEKFFLDPARGLGLFFIRDDHKRLSAGIGYEFGRDEEDGPLLLGQPEIDGGLTLNLSGRYPFGRFLVVDGTISHQVTGSDTGTTIDVGIATRFALADNLTVAPGVQVTWADEEHHNALFGAVPTPAVSAYEAGSGIKTAGLRVLTRYQLSEHWALINVTFWNQLQGDAADSPLVEDDNNLLSITALSYIF